MRRKYSYFYAKYTSSRKLLVDREKHYCTDPRLNLNSRCRDGLILERLLGGSECGVWQENVPKEIQQEKGK